MGVLRVTIAKKNNAVTQQTAKRTFEEEHRMMFLHKEQTKNKLHEQPKGMSCTGDHENQATSAPLVTVSHES